MNRHDVQWTPDKIKGFWDYIAGNPALSRMYFTLEVGKGVARDVAHTLDLRGKEVLDFGAGPGNLFLPLAGSIPGLRYHGADFSSGSVEEMRRRFTGHASFAGAHVIDGFPSSIPGSYDAIVCCEVVEHLDDATLQNVFREFARLIKPGGTLYLTTPNDEDLEESKVMCPDCGGVFHRWQHQRSWRGEALTQALAPHGFKVRLVEELTYANRPFLGGLKTAAKRAMGRKAPSLKWVGVKA